MGRKSVVPLVLVVFATVTALWFLRPQRRAMWTAAPGEKIVYLRTGNAHGHIFVASERKGAWYVRDVDERGRALTVASGTGRLGGAGTVAPSWRYDRAVVQVTNNGKPHHSLLDCDLRTGRSKVISGSLSATSFNLRHPYSPDCRWLVFTGCDQSTGRSNPWLLDTCTGRIRAIRYDTYRTICDVAWDRKGVLCLVTWSARVNCWRENRRCFIGCACYPAARRDAHRD